MALKNQLKEWVIGMRMFLLADASFLIRFFYANMWKPKPNSLAQILDQFSKSKKDVFCVQVGSNDGFQHDPLCKFIKRDRWKGVLLEPQKHAFEKLQYIYKSDSVKPLNKALDKIDEQRKLFKVAFSNARWATGLSSFNESQIRAMVDSGHIARQCAKAGITPPENPDDYITHDLVDCVSFDTLIQQNQIERIDLIHIDTEGYDYEILKLFPFQQFRPQVVIFEHSHLKEEEKQAAKQLLEEKGYQLQSFGADTVGLLNVT